MELPGPLRAAVDELLTGMPMETLATASARLSDRYRREVRDGRFHLDGVLAAKAYLATRLPATFAAVRTALAMVEDVAPDFAPRGLIDLGAGPGTALWAAGDCFDSLRDADMVEASAAIRNVGADLARHCGVTTRWHEGDVAARLPDLAPADLVTLAYVLDELPPEKIIAVTARLWALTKGVLLIVEPGTPAGWQRILTARSALIAAGARLLAPCPHATDCPLSAPDWCHFSRRVARSRLHRLAKHGEVPWEDEKFIYIAAARDGIVAPPTENETAARILAPPRIAGGVARLKLCLPQGQAAELQLSRRDGAAFKAARRAEWGERLLPADEVGNGD